VSVLSRAATALCIATATLLLGCAGASSQPLASEIFPPLNSPRLRFHTGGVEHGAPQISPLLPDIPAAPPSPWFVTQWQQSELLSAGLMKRRDPATSDPMLGVADYAFTAPDGHSHVWVYQQGEHGNPVYELLERGGILKQGGASNLYLSAHVITAPPTFDHVIEFRLLAKLSRAIIAYDRPIARETGAVLGMAYAGFAITVPDPAGYLSTIFLQISLANSRETAPLKAQCTLQRLHRTIILGGSPSGEPPLHFRTDHGPMHQVYYRLNDILCELVRKPLACRSADGQVMTFDASRLELSRSTLGGTYIGLETSNRDERPHSPTSDSQGQVEMALQISDVHVTQNLDQPFSFSACR
jgi:hypothetical protein